MARQRFEKTRPAFRSFARHLRPQLRWIPFRAAEIGEALADQCRRALQTAQQITGEIVGCADGENIYRVDGRISVRPLESVVFFGVLVALNDELALEQGVVDGLVGLEVV